MHMPQICGHKMGTIPKLGTPRGATASGSRLAWVSQSPRAHTTPISHRKASLSRHVSHHTPPSQLEEADRKALTEGEEEARQMVIAVKRLYMHVVTCL